jgi:hypothetical protein
VSEEKDGLIEISREQQASLRLLMSFCCTKNSEEPDNNLHFSMIIDTLCVASIFVAGMSYEFMVGLLSAKGLRVFNAALIGAVMVCSGLIAAHEFWLNPVEDSERGEWTNRQLFYAGVFGISLFLSFWFVPSAILAHEVCEEA